MNEVQSHADGLRRSNIYARGPIRFNLLVRCPDVGGPIRSNLHPRGPILSRGSNFMQMLQWRPISIPEVQSQCMKFNIHEAV